MGMSRYEWLRVGAIDSAALALEHEVGVSKKMARKLATVAIDNSGLLRRGVKG